MWIYVMRNRPLQVRARYERLEPGASVMSPIVLGELHVGWRKSAQAEANRSVLDQYLRTTVHDPVDDAVAGAYGELRAELEARGTPIGANDLWIAAHARERGCVLVTHDIAEYERVRGLRIEDWART